ncbi:MAG: hypothetical protein AAF211_20165, partial [Myxococcota bacterium]
KWPSQTWDDEHFGSFWRGADAPPDEGGQATAERPTEPRSTPPVRPRSPSPERARRRPMPKKPAGVRRTSRGPDRQTRAPSPSPRKPEASAANLPAVQPPPLEELEQLIATIGLAGTVQSIMQRTGWDFRKAAHYLAKVRQGS